jgi:hypothetical protein
MDGKFYDEDTMLDGLAATLGKWYLKIQAGREFPAESSRALLWRRGIAPVIFRAPAAMMDATKERGSGQ